MRERGREEREGGREGGGGGGGGEEEDPGREERMKGPGKDEGTQGGREGCFSALD